jgi:chemosensory pili system protein ChpA (sensor histidine kinase/response regulator)
MAAPPRDGAGPAPDLAPAVEPEPLAEWNPEESELLRELFLAEAEDHLRHIADAQQALIRAAERLPGADSAAIADLFRDLHRLKGAAGSVGFAAIGRAAHDLEGLCAEIQSGRLAATPGILERLDEGVASLRALLEGARAAPGHARRARGMVRPAVVGPGARDLRTPFERRQAGERTVRVSSDRLDALLDGVGDLVILRTRVERRLRELEGVLRDLGATRTNLRDVVNALGSETPPRPGARGEDAERGLVSLVDRLGEVEVEFTDAVAYLDRATKALGAETESLRRTGDNLEEQVRRARRVQLESVYARLGAALREFEPAGCRAELVASGGDIELDKGVVEQLGDPLLHLLRNAVAHGIEPEAERVARGKPAVGRIEISAREEGEFVYIELGDDGRGIDRELVRQALVRKGRLAPAAPLDEAALLAALFEPGFSSRPRSDALAGRGMGLDIVKQAIERLGGEMSIEYEPGALTRFRLAVPLTAAITQALLFKVGGQVYAVPAAHVVEALPVGLDDLPARGRQTAARVVGEGLPVLRLQALLGVETPPGRRGAALHIRYGERSFIATCDKIIGPRTIVVRPLGSLLGALPLYAGVTVSGAGKAQLVLDLAALAEAAQAPARPAPAPLRRGQPRVLVVDDSRLSREACARVLGSAGYHPVTAEDGWEAWEMLGERRFEAVVTDLEMPRLDGFELIARIRQDPTLRRLPVIVLSSRTSQGTRERAIEAGASLVLPKVPHKRALGDALAALLAGSPAHPRPSDGQVG